MRDTRMWAAVIAVAFLVLWFVGVGAAYAAPVEEPLPQPEPAVLSDGARAVGTVGWALVGIGFLGVAVSAAFGSRTPRYRTRRLRAYSPSRNGSHVRRSVYTPPPTRRYRRNIERRLF